MTILPTHASPTLPEPGGCMPLADLRHLDMGRIEVWMVDPDTAKRWLAYNTHNRNLRGPKVRQFAGDMNTGDWLWTGEPVRFAIDGTLLDGQTRLHGIVESGVTIPLLVVFDLSPEVQPVIDTGTPRKLHDVLKLRGEPNASSLAAILRAIEAWDHGVRRNWQSFTSSHSRCLHFLDEHPEIKDLVNPARTVGDKCGLPAAIVGVLWWVTEQVDADDAEFFWHRLGDGQGLVKGDPIFELRRTLQESKSVRSQRDRTWLAAITVKAWNAYRRGETVALYRWRPGGAKPESFPEPV